MFKYKIFISNKLLWIVFLMVYIFLIIVNYINNIEQNIYINYVLSFMTGIITITILSNRIFNIKIFNEKGEEINFSSKKEDLLYWEEKKLILSQIEKLQEELFVTYVKKDFIEKLKNFLEKNQKFKDNDFYKEYAKILQKYIKNINDMDTSKFILTDHHPAIKISEESVEVVQRFIKRKNIE